jgi:hypothetical protein
MKCRPVQRSIPTPGWAVARLKAFPDRQQAEAAAAARAAVPKGGLAIAINLADHEASGQTPIVKRILFQMRCRDRRSDNFAHVQIL